MPSSSLILEAGCGLGRWVFYLNDLGFQTIGIDVTKSALRSALEYAKRTNKNIDLIVADVKYLPFRDNVFDLILSLGVIEHFVKAKRDNVIKESYWCLKQKGRLFLSTPNQFHIAYSLLRILDKFRKKWEIGLEYSFTTKDLTRFLKAKNFQIVDQGIFGFKYASYHVVGVLPFLWPFLRAYSDIIHFAVAHILRKFRIFGFYAYTVGVKA
jgi:2-polyprenyl-3-methyl-5-hydroxy-6-metoxy-1,4-benzoquinol methylase